MKHNPKKLTTHGFAHVIILCITVVAVALIGSYFLVFSKASTSNVTQNFSGRFAGSGDTKSYPIKAGAGTLNATLTSTKSTPMTLKLTDSTGRQLTSASGSSPVRISSAVTEGTYTVTVTGQKASYTLSVDSPPVPAPAPTPTPTPPPTSGTAPTVENFSTYTMNKCFPDASTFGPWTSTYNGYGCNQIVSGDGKTYIQESPQASTRPDETHASLVVGQNHTGPISFKVSAKTFQQLRTGSAPNAWETTWVVWNYTDDVHFYYFALKTNGWELGKEDPAYPGAQRYLATGTDHTYPVGSWNDVSIAQDAANKITVTVNGTVLTSFTDTERPYSSGKPGFYNEDAKVGFTNYSLIY